MAKSLIDAIKDKDWHAANEAFSGIMQRKIADRLVSERKELFKEQDGRFDALDPKKEKQADDDAAEDDVKKKGETRGTITGKKYTYSKEFQDAAKKDGPSAEVDKDNPKKIIVKEDEKSNPKTSKTLPFGPLGTKPMNVKEDADVKRVERRNVMGRNTNQYRVAVRSKGNGDDAMAGRSDKEGYVWKGITDWQEFPSQDAAEKALRK
jgi:hypothetical protein